MVNAGCHVNHGMADRKGFLTADGNTFVVMLADKPVDMIGQGAGRRRGCQNILCVTAQYASSGALFHSERQRAAALPGGKEARQAIADRSMAETTRRGRPVSDCL
jgi:hypothetical protein